MKILIAVDTIPYTSETFILNHIKGLLDVGVRVSIIAFNKPNNQLLHPVFLEYNMDAIIKYKPVLPSNFYKRIIKGVKIFTKSILVNCTPTLRSLNFIKYGLDALKLILLYEMSTFVTNEKYDVIHCHYGTMARKVLFYQEWGLIPAPLVTTFHGYDIDLSSIRNTLGFYDDLIAHGTRFIVNSKYTLSRIHSLCFPASKSLIIPVSLDTNFFKRNVQREVGYSMKIRIITVARLVEFKGIEFALRGISLLNSDIKNKLDYIIIGDGPLRDSLENLVIELGLDRQVSFTGSRTQDFIKEQMELSDIFLLSGILAKDGRQENQGLVIQEAQAMELPVIVSNIGGVAEGIIENETGFLVEPGNILDIQNKLNVLLENHELRRKMGIAGRSYVEKNFSIEAINRKLLTCYRDILS